MSNLHFIKIEPLPKPEKRPSRFSALLLWVIASAGLVISSLLLGLIAPLMEGMNAFAMQLVVDALFYLPFAALPLVLLAKRRPGLYEAYRPNPISLFNVISIVILALLGVFFVNDITVLWSIPFQKLGLDVFTGSLPIAANTHELVISIISVAMIPAICEEFVFRGAVMSGLERYGTRHAMVVSALLFAVLHGSFVGFPAQFLLGLVLAMLVFWTDSIYAGLIYHTVHNSAILILEYVQNQIPADPSAGSDLLTLIGGWAGVLELGLSVALSGLLMHFSLRLFMMRGRLQGIFLEKRQKARLAGREIAVLIAGILVCALLFASDILAMQGGIAP